MKNKHSRLIAVSSLAAGLLATSPAAAVPLPQAVQEALKTSPQINQATQNREAIEFERRQARGLLGPRLSVEASAGARRLENATRRSLGIADDVLFPLEADLVAEQTLLDFGRRKAELDRQASRIDGAAYRVRERAEFVALNVSRHYFDYLLQQRLLAAAEDNAAFHEKLVGDLRQAVAQGSISIADQQQAEERLQAARARVTEAREALQDADIQFRQLTGVPIGQPTLPPAITTLPANAEEAVAVATVENPLVRQAQADLDAARAVVRGARAELSPRILAEGRLRGGDDIDGFRGRTTDYLGRVVFRWSILDGGINRARVGEMTAREGEQQARLDEAVRQAEADARLAWNRYENQQSLLGQLDQQSRVSDDLLMSYREQFNVGRRSLLDVLDAQNTRYNVQVQAETARLAHLYAQYRVLAAQNRLLQTLGVAPPAAAEATARERYRVAPSQLSAPRQGPVQN